MIKKFIAKLTSSWDRRPNYVKENLRSLANRIKSDGQIAELRSKQELEREQEAARRQRELDQPTVETFESEIQP